MTETSGNKSSLKRMLIVVFGGLLLVAGILTLADAYRYYHPHDTKHWSITVGDEPGRKWRIDLKNVDDLDCYIECFTFGRLGMEVKQIRRSKPTIPICTYQNLRIERDDQGNYTKTPVNKGNGEWTWDGCNSFSNPRPASPEHPDLLKLIKPYIHELDPRIQYD